jgi:hypothetical protein
MAKDISKDCWWVVDWWDTVYITINKISRFGISSIHIKSDDVLEKQIF